jgi:hypothetical protein
MARLRQSIACKRGTTMLWYVLDHEMKTATFELTV